MQGPSLAALIENQLPDFIVEDYPLVTNFLSKYYEALSIGEGPTSIIQNFEKYLDVDTFSPEILVKTCSLEQEIADGSANIHITVDKTDGFPDKNGLIMIDQEIFLYETKNDTQFQNCIRGYSAKTTIGDLYNDISFVDSNTDVHKQFAEVSNLSNLLLAGLIKQYEEQYTSGFPYQYLRDQSNKNLLVKRIKDFYQVKGTPQSLEFIFQILFSVKPDIFYPKENVFKSSESGWNSKELLLVEVISGDIREVVGNEIRQVPDPYNPELTAALAIIDNIVGEPYQGSRLYTLTISPGSKEGKFSIARRTFLMNALSQNAGVGDRIDVFSTIGFPERDGRVVIGTEEITYSTKTATQFIIAERDSAIKDVASKRSYFHKKSVRCFTKNNLTGRYTDEFGIPRETQLRIYGLVSGLTSEGLELESSSLIYGETGDQNTFDVEDGGIPYIAIDNMVEFSSSGFFDDLPLTNEWVVNENFSKLAAFDPSNIGSTEIKNKLLSDVSAIYRDTKNYYIASSGFPSYSIGPFDNTSVPQDQEHLKIIPRTPIDASVKQYSTNREVGVLVNGVPLLNHRSPNGIEFGAVDKIVLTDSGRGYTTPPTVNIAGNAEAYAELNGLGEVTNIVLTNNGSGYSSPPTVELSSGSGGQFTVLIQQGQIATISLSINSQAQIIDAGQDYTEPPNVFIYDASGKGKGALFTCQIDTSTGQITGFTQLSGGFDYQEDTTTVTLAPKHQIAAAEAELTQWKFNTYFEETVDNGNTSGIVYESPDINYGYAYSHIIAPTSLKILRVDNVDSQGNPLTIKSHSPILGWAYDGNPIYGSFGYDNPYQDVQAASPTIKRLQSSWRIKTTRGNDSPSETTYSLGRFVNDYEYIERLGDLDANNGRFCTTPEFPDGVYAYFMTTDENEGPSFPYSIGEAFYNVPVEENWKLSARQRDLPYNVRRRRVNASEESGELLTSRVSGVNYGPVTNIEVHSSSQNFTNEDVIFVDNAANDSGDGLFAAVNEIQGQEVEQLSCNNPKNNYLITNNILFLNHETVITQNNTGASAKVIGQIEENDRFVVKDVTGTFNLTDTISSTTEIYNLTFDNTIIADIGSEVVLQVQSAGVAHEVAVGKVLRNVFDKNTVIVELQLANPDENTTLDEDGVTTITIPRSSYTNIGYFAIGNGVNIGAVSATIVNIRSLSKDFKLLDIEDNIAVLKTKDKFHGLAVGDDVIVTVEPNSSIATQRYDVETKKYHTIQLNNIERSTAINYSGLSRISIIGAGTSFAPSQTYTGVTAEFFGEGRLGVTHGSLNITTDANGRVATAVIADGGAGYQYGDVVSVAVGTLGGNVQSQKPSFFVDAAGFGYNETELIVDNSNGISTGDIIQITEERLEVVSVTGNIITVIRGAQNTEIVDHLDDIAVELVTKTYRFTKDSVVNFGSSNAYVDNYDPSTQQLDVYYVNEGDQIIADNSIFVDESTPTKQAQIDSVTDTSLRFRFRKDGESEWFKNISLDIQRTYRYIFDTSSPTLVGRHLKFYENVYRTRNLLQAFESIEKPGFSGSYTSFQLGYGIPIDGTNWEQKPVIAVPPKIYYDEPLSKINSEDQFFTLVEDPFAGKHAVFYGFEYEFAYRLPKAPQQEGFTNVQYFTDSLYAIGSIKNVKVISGGKNFTLPPQLPGVFLNKRFRGAFTPLIEDGKITSVNIIDTGLNYSQPKVLLENTGGGANAQFRVELTNQGAVGRIVPTEEGSGYGPDTTVRLYESDAKLYAHGENIGRLATLEIISSGKNFNNDPSLLPQVNPPIVMTLRNFPDRAFLNGEQITQRDANGKMIAFGRVDYWINGMNILRIKQVQGKFDQRYPLYGEALRSTADIQKIYVAKIDPVIGPTSTSIGNFQTDRSKLSAVSQKIQDGIYYQDYSYVVKSTISINDWRDFVKKFTHPAGFNLFGEVLIESFGDAEQPATIDTPQSGTKDNGFGAVISIIEPGVLGVTTSHKATRITQSHVRVDTFRQQRGLGTLNYSERNNVEIEVFDLAVSPEFDGEVQVDGSVTGTRTFTLFKKDINEPLVPYKAQQLLVTLDGVLQDPDTAYTVSGSTITFAEAPLGPFVDAKTGINVPGVNFYGKSIKFQDNINNDRYMLEANNITSQFDGTSTNFDLGIEIVNDDHVFISLDGVLQEPGVAYNLVEGGAGEVTFTEPPRQVGKILELDITDATNFLVNDFVVGQTSGARGEIVAKRYFVDHRFLNAADLLADNSTILAEEAVGILDDTSKFDGFTYPGLGRNQCITDLKSVLKNISRDLQLGGNSNTWDAAKEYLLNPADPNSDLKHIEGEVEATLWAMKYFKDMSILTIRNHFGIGNLTSQQRFADTTFSMTPTNALYTASSGVLVLTLPGHELSSSDKVAIATDSLVFTCDKDSNQTQHSYPRSTDPAAGVILSIVSISGDDVTINVGASPAGEQYSHSFVSSSANSIGKYNDVYNKTNAVADEFIDSANLLNANRNFIAEEAVAMMLAGGGTISDPAFNTAVSIVSATATTITVDVGKSDSIDAHTFDSALANSVITGGNYTHTLQEVAANSIQVTSGPALTPTDATYDPATGEFVMTVVGHTLTTSSTVTIADDAFIFRCSMDQNATPHSYPRSTDPASGQQLAVTSVTTDTFTVNVGVSAEVTFTPTNGTYDPLTGMMMLDIGTHTLAQGTSIRLLTNGISFTCDLDNYTVAKAYPRASSPGSSDDCCDDVKDMLKAIAWNLQYGGNNKVWDAAELYVDRDGYLNHITQKVPETLQVFANVKTLAADVIRNNVITPAGTHGVTQVFDNSITVETNECASVESAIGVLVDLVGNAIQTPSTFEANVARTLPLVWPTEFSTLTPTRDLTITIDAANPYCQQVESAVNVLFNIVTTTISEAAFNNTNHLLNVAQDFPNPNRIQVEMTKKDFLQGEDIQSEASLLTATTQSVSSINPGIQQKFFGFKQGKYYKLDSIESQFNDAQTIFDLERSGVPFYSERSQNLVVILNGVMQVNRVAYRVEDNLVVFNEAPAFGSACFILYFYGLDPERVLIGYNIEPPGTFKKFFKLTLDQQILLPLEGAQCWVSTEPVTNIVREYPYSFARGRIYKQAWTPGQQNVLFVEGVTAQKSNWLNGTLSVTRDRGSTAPIIELQILDVEEQVNEDFREKLFNRQDRIKSNLSQGDLIKIDGEAETRGIVRAARDALVTSGYDSDTSGIVSSFFRSYEYEVVLNVGPYSGQIEGFGAQAIAKIDAEVRFHTLQSSRTEGVEFLPGDEVVQYQDQNDTSSPVIWRAVVKAYAPKDKAIEFRSEYIDGTTPVVYTDPDVNTFRTGERIYVEATPSTNAIALQYLEPGGVNRVVLTRRDNSAYYESFREWKQANVWNKGENLLGNGFVPMNASANNEPGEYDFTSSIYDDQLNPQISKNYREPPVMIFRSSPVTDSNGDSLGSPTGGGARATAIVVRGEIVDTELISSGSGYKVPPQILFTRGYFVFRKDPLSVANFTTFGIEPPTIDSPVGVQSFLQTIFKGGDRTRWTLFNSYAPAGDNLVFGNAGAPIYQVKKYYDGRVIIQKILDLTNKMHPQPEIYINLAPEDVRCYWKETTVLQSQMTGGVQGISCALTKYKKTETKVQYNAGVIEKRAFNNPNLIGFDTYNTGSLGLTIGSLESMKFEIQPQSNNSIGQNGYYTDSAGRQINYVMGDMNLDFWSNLYPNLTIGDFENPDILNSQVYAEGDQNYFRYQQGSEIHFRTTSKAMILDNTFGDDVLLVNSTKGFPASGGKLIIADVAADKREEMTYTSSTSDRFLGVQRLNPLSTVEEGSRFAAMTNTKLTQYVSLSNGGTGLSYNGGFISDVQYYLFYGGNVGSNRIIHWTFSTANEIQSFQNHNTITVEYIRGTGSNGGEYPGQDLELWFWSANTNYVKAGNVWSSGDAAGGDWSTTTLNIPATIQTEINNGNAYRMYFQQLSIQAGGADYFGLRTWWLDDTDGEPTYPKGTVVMSANKL
jgi:hypothetical protein